MAKSDTTIQLERNIWKTTAKMGIFGCFEVTIGWVGRERVDYMTYDTNGIWRCYEIKASKADFNSKSKNTFIGHFNYYVMPKELYDQVKDEIPKHVGVYIDGLWNAKKAKRQELSADEQVLKDSLIRSLCRVAEKIYQSENPPVIDSLKRQIREAERLVGKYREKYWEVRKQMERGI